MARSYAVTTAQSNASSATLPLLTIIGSTSVRAKIFAFDISGEGSPSDDAVKLTWQRCTTTGTPGSNVTPQALDPADPSAQSTCGVAGFSVGPTLTASAFLWLAAINRRPTFHFQVAPTKEFVIPATANNGLALLSLAVTNAWTQDMTVHFEE